MSPEAQRIAIAEACGWKNADHPDVMKFKEGWTMPEKWCMDPRGVLRLNHDRPNYLSDLNAMHEAEKLLTASQYRAFVDQLREVVFMAIEGGAAYCARFSESATAAQRAEAFLRAIGKWEDGK